MKKVFALISVLIGVSYAIDPIGGRIRDSVAAHGLATVFGTSGSSGVIAATDAVSDSANAVSARNSTTFSDVRAGACFDLDFAEDVDKLIAAALMFRAVDKGDLDLVCLNYVNRQPYGPRAIGAISSFYGYKEIPIGTQKTLGGHEGVDFYGTYLASTFASHIRNATPNTFDEVANAVNVYRKALARSPDHSFKLAFLGQLRNFRDLWHSPPDSISALSGKDLILLKAQYTLFLVGRYPFSVTPENNCATDIPSCKIIDTLSNSMHVIFSGEEYGDHVSTKSNQPIYSPVRAAFDYGLHRIDSTATYRPSWSAMATYFIAYGCVVNGDTVCRLSAKGTNVIDNSGNNVFTTGGSKEQYYLIQVMNTDTLEARLQAMADSLPLNPFVVGRPTSYGYVLNAPLATPEIVVNGPAYLGTTSVNGSVLINGFDFTSEPGSVGVRAADGHNGVYWWENQDRTKPFAIFQPPTTGSDYLTVYSAFGGSVMETFNGTNGNVGIPGKLGIGIKDALYESQVAVPFDKTDATPRCANAFITSNDASNPFGGVACVVGGASDAARGVLIQTGQLGATADGYIAFQWAGGGQVSVGTTTHTYTFNVGGTSNGPLWLQNGDSLATKIYARSVGGGVTAGYTDSLWRRSIQGAPNAYGFVGTRQDTGGSPFPSFLSHVWGGVTSSGTRVRIDSVPGYTVGATVFMDNGSGGGFDTLPNVFGLAAGTRYTVNACSNSIDSSVTVRVDGGNFETFTPSGNASTRLPRNQTVTISAVPVNLFGICSETYSWDPLHNAWAVVEQGTGDPY